MRRQVMFVIQTRRNRNYSSLVSTVWVDASTKNPVPCNRLACVLRNYIKVVGKPIS